MDYTNLIETVRTEHDHQKSVEDQVRVIRLVGRHGYAHSKSLLQSEIEEYAEAAGIEFDCADAGPALGNLVDLDILQRSQPAGDRTYVISERRDEIVNGEFEPTLRTDREALIDHIQADDPPEDADAATATDGGTTVRHVVADTLDVPPAGVEAHLRAGGPRDQREPMNTAIDAIVDHDEVNKRDTYDKITLRRSGYHYRFTESVKAQIGREGNDADN
jgi:hypothetical protein